MNHLLSRIFTTKLKRPQRTTSRLNSITSLSILFVVCAFPLKASNNDFTKEVDSVVEKALDEFNTPGMAVGVTYKGKPILAKGYGRANLTTNLPVDQHTYFRLASTSKAFTAAALAILVDQEKLNWESKVIDYIPQFKLKDPYVTREFTILDLLTHRSGLVSGAGDSMIWPEPSGFSRQEVIQSLQFLSPQYSFRAQYAYSNVLYITAGEVVAAITGMSFDEFVEKEIFHALEMDCYVGDIPTSKLNNAAMSYGYNDEKGIYAIPRNRISEAGLMSAAAGGMVCNVDSMLKWANALLQQNNLPFSEEQLTTMWQGHTILRASTIEKEWDGTSFKSYGLGWRLSNIGQFRVISHTGTLSGYQAYVVLVPEIELGVIILNNGSNSAARGSVMQTILKKYLSKYGLSAESYPNTDWIETYNEYLDEREQKYLENYEKPVASAPMNIDSDGIVGTYTDKWFGDFVITKQSALNEELPIFRISSSRMSTLKGTLYPFQDSTYKIEWDNKNAASDAFMHFETNVKRQITGAKLHPFTVEQLNNHEYRDMHFIKVVSEE